MAEWNLNTKTTVLRLRSNCCAERIEPSAHFARIYNVYRLRSCIALVSTVNVVWCCGKWSSLNISNMQIMVIYPSHLLVSLRTLINNMPTNTRTAQAHACSSCDTNVSESNVSVYQINTLAATEAAALSSISKIIHSKPILSLRCRNRTLLRCTRIWLSFSFAWHVRRAYTQTLTSHMRMYRKNGYSAWLFAQL